VKPAGALALLFVATGCARQSVAPRQDSPVDSPPAVTLQRTACFGSCPVYRVSITPAGAVTFEGTAHVRKLGTASGQIAPARLDHLLRELDEAGYFSFADRYTSADPTCGRYVTDLPTVITSVTLEGRTKRIEHDQGCGAAPGALVVLERRIDEVLGSGQWTGR
jgi:uncharacterized protein DUF6438